LVAADLTADEILPFIEENYPVLVHCKRPSHGCDVSDACVPGASSHAARFPRTGVVNTRLTLTENNVPPGCFRLSSAGKWNY
jgi:hypothetical protein